MDTTLQQDQLYFGSWTITRKLDQGSNGQLYQIHKKDAMGNDCCSAMKVICIPENGESEVKALLSSGIAEEDLEAYYQSVIDSAASEFTILARLKGNTNIVSYEDHEIIRHKDSFGWDIRIRMEEITPFLDYSLDHEITEEDVLKLGIDLCHGLALCSRHHIIHRDIKPANIFVSENGDFKIGDFGIARILEQTQMRLSRKGTFSYMAPEVFQGDPYTENADLYSLGLVMYQYLNNGRGPFMPAFPKPVVISDEEKAFADRMSGCELPEPANGSTRLKEIVLKACAYDNRQRYATAQEMLEDLEALREEGRQTSRREQRLSRLPSYKRSLYRFWSRRKKALIAALLLLIVCGSVGFSLYLRGVTDIQGPAENTTILIGDSLAPEYTVEPFWFRDSKIHFSSSDEDILTVDKSGKLTAAKVGDAVLTMECRSHTEVCRIKVLPKVKSIRNVKDLKLLTGKKKQLKPVLKPDKYADEKVTYRSSDKAIAAVSDKGVITAKKAGNATISIEAGGTAKTLHVTISEPPPPEEPEVSAPVYTAPASSSSGTKSGSSGTKSKSSGSSKSKSSGSSSKKSQKSKSSGKKDYFGDEEYF